MVKDKMQPLTSFIWIQIHRIQEFPDSSTIINICITKVVLAHQFRWKETPSAGAEKIKVQQNSTHLLSSIIRDERSARTFRSCLTKSTGKVDVSVSSPVWSIDCRKSMHRWLCFFPEPRDVSSITSPSRDESRRTLLMFFFISLTAATAT